jgi:hypothetical protein
MTRTTVFLLAVCLTGSLALGDVTLTIPDEERSIPVTQDNFSLIATFLNTGSSVPLVGYDVAITITPVDPNMAGKLTITGVGTGANRAGNAVLVGSDPTFFTATEDGKTLYAISDFLTSGSGSITNNSALAKILFRAEVGAKGIFNVDWYLKSGSAYRSVLYQDTSETPVSLTFDGGQISFVPEPVTMALLGLGGLALLRRRR